MCTTMCYIALIWPIDWSLFMYPLILKCSGVLACAFIIKMFKCFLFWPVLLFFFPALTWTMARHQEEVLWTPWPVRAQAWSYRPTSCTVREGSPFSTARTVTMTCHPSPCPETRPLPVTCKFSHPGSYLTDLMAIWSESLFMHTILSCVSYT